MGKAVFVGDVALDEYYCAPYFPKLKEKISVKTLSPQTGGTIANAACVYASYGTAVEFCSVLNCGPTSQMLIEDLQKSGVNTKLIMRDKSLPDSKTIIILSEGEHTIFIPQMNIKAIELTPNALDILRHAKFIYSNIHEIKLLRSGAQDAREILDQCKQNGVLIAFDLDVADFRAESEREFLSFIDIIFVNEIGFNNLLNGMQEHKMLSRLFSCDTKLIIKTVAEKGCVAYTREGKISLPGVPVQVVDVTGAGDTFCASFLYAYEHLQDIRQACLFANYAAAHSVTIMGARGGVSNANAVISFMQENGEGIEPFKTLIQQ